MPEATYLGRSVCTLDCPDACLMRVSRDPSGAYTVQGDPEHPYTRGFVCPKGRRLAANMTRPDRITTPLLRLGGKAGRLTPVSWDDALGELAGRIDALRALPDGPARILHVHGHGYRGVLAQGSTVLFGRLGASTTRGSLCDDAGIAACLEDFAALDHNDPALLQDADRIVNWGKDLGRSSPHTARLVALARQKGARVTTIGPGAGEQRTLCDRHIRIRPGTDRFLAAAVLALRLAEGELDPASLGNLKDTDGFLELLRTLDPAALLAVCQVELDDALELARLYAPEPPAATLIGWGVQRHPFGAQNVRWINALAYLSGHVGTPGGVFFNIPSGRNLGTWNAEPLTSARSLALPRLAAELEAADPPVELIWVDGTNLVNQVPEAPRMARAFAATPFTVVLEALPNDTTALADLVLPCALAWEREDAVGSCLHGVVSRCAPLAKPPGQARGDYAILAELGRRLAEPILLPEPETALRQALDSVPELPGGLDALRQQDFVRANRPQVAFPGGRTAHPDGRYNAPDRLDPEPGPETSDSRTLRLLTLVRGSYLHSQIPPGEVGGPLPAWIAPDSPALAGVTLYASGLPARLESEQGGLEVRLLPDPALHPGVVVLRRGGWLSAGACPNVLVAGRETDLGGNAAQYGQYVRVVLTSAEGIKEK